MTTKLRAPFDTQDPLARIQGESLRANQALKDYYMMGAGRGLRQQAANYIAQSDNGESTPTIHFRTLAAWSGKYSWQARIEAQGNLDFAKDQVTWDERRRLIRETDWTQGRALRGLADRILAEGPNFIKARRKVLKGRPRVINTDGAIVDPGEPDREVITMALDTGTAIYASKTGSQLERIAAGMVTDNQGLELGGTITTKTESVGYANLDSNKLSELLTASAGLLLEISRRGGANKDAGSNESTNQD